jgi:hypothetical protein
MLGFSIFKGFPGFFEIPSKTPIFPWLDLRFWSPSLKLLDYNRTFDLFQVQNLLQNVQDKFQTMSDQIISRIDDMSVRIDDLEKSIGECLVLSIYLRSFY